MVAVVPSTGAVVARVCLDATSAGDAALLCGAGVSMQPPSSCPSGPQLLANALGELITEPGLVSVVEEIERNPRWPGVVPEVVFQFVVDDVGEVPAAIYTQLNTAVPNLLHRLIAMTVTVDNCALATTNFDRLFTRADPRVEPIHLHGHIDAHDTMVATIRRVGRGLLLETAERFRQALTAASTLIVLGYSGNDDDVMSEIVHHAPARIVWVVRDANDWALTNISRLAHVTHLEVAAADLREVADAWEVLRPAPTRPARPPQARLSAVPVRVSPALQATILVGCCQTIDEYARAADIALAARATARPLPDEAARLTSLAAHCFDRLGDCDRAAQLAAEALASPSLAPRSRYLLATEAGLAAADRTPPDRPIAETHLLDALTVAQQLAASDDPDDLTLLASAHHNLAYLETRCFICGEPADLARAETEYRLAFQMKETAGDLLYTQSSARNLAALLVALGRDADAAPFRERYEEIVSRLGMRWDSAYFDALLGQLLVACGRTADARRHLTLARDAFAQIDDQEVWVDRLEKLLRELSSTAATPRSGSIPAAGHHPTTEL